MENKFTYLYAVIKSGISGNNIIESYYPLMANIIINNNIVVIDEEEIVALFRENYGIEVSPQFVRQVLNTGMKDNSIVDVRGQYKTNLEEMKKHVFSDSDFNDKWEKLLDGFLTVTNEKKLGLEYSEIEEYVLDFFDDNYSRTLTETDIELPETSELLDYCWYFYLQELIKNDSHLFEFVTYISLSRVYEENLFYNASNDESLNNLNLYLDTPILFAILGMDTNFRKESYIDLIKVAQNRGCNIYVFDNNYDEALGILETASYMAFSNMYDMSKANKVAQFFHDNLKDEREANEFIQNVEKELNDLGVVIKKTEYDFTDNKFQEDETQLTEMIKERYADHGTRLSQERLRSIQVDVRSIVMIYRERHGRVSTTIGGAKELLVTINTAIATVSKLYESNKSNNSGHMPAAIEADVLGAIVWLNSPKNMVEFEKKQLLFNCYNMLRPNQRVLKKYLDSVELARQMEEIDEDKYLLLRAHPLVKSALMNVTQGDYSRFNDRTYEDVYNNIVETSLEKFYEEEQRHNNTKQKLEHEKAHRIQAEKEIEGKNEIIQSVREDSSFFESKLIKGISIGLTILFLGVPYVLMLIVLEVLSAKFIDWSYKGVIYAAIIVLLTIIAGFAYTKLKVVISKFSANIVKKMLSAHHEKNRQK